MRFFSNFKHETLKELTELNSNLTPRQQQATFYRTFPYYVGPDLNKKRYPSNFSLDNDVTDTSDLNIRIMFRGLPKPIPELYRNQVYTKICYNKDSVYCHSNNIRIEPLTDNFSNKVNELITEPLPENFYYARVLFDGKDLQQWQPLPSITSMDQLTAIAASVPIEIAYSKQTNLYYIRSKDSSNKNNIEVKYNIKTKPANILSEDLLTQDEVISINKELGKFKFTGDIEADKSQLPFLSNLSTQKKAVALQYYFLHNFKPGEAGLFDSYQPNINLLNALLTHKKGVCRHVSMLFMAFADLLQLDARLIINDAHAFAEVESEDTLFTLNLGGGNSSTKNYISLIEDAEPSHMKKFIKISTPLKGIQLKDSINDFKFDFGINTNTNTFNNNLQKALEDLWMKINSDNAADAMNVFAQYGRKYQKR